jgi:ubiquinone/menaquinone biosynthesis C-methylase UbiE
MGTSTEEGFVSLSFGEVPGAFDAGAPAYDKLVGANPGYHAHLRLSAQRMRLPDKGEGLRLLDAGCGTGASTAALVSVAPKAQIVAVDASSGMLAEAAAKPWPSSVAFVESRIEDLAEAGVAGPFDGIFAAYLVRNLADKDAQLRAFRALLRPGGTLAVHEYSVRDSRLATAVWNAVCTTIIIPSGRVRTGDSTLYKYLRRSVNRFDGAGDFRDRLRANGFTSVRSETMPGWQRNIVHTFLGQAPR